MSVTQKPKPFKMRITDNQLVQIAIQSVRTKSNLDDFWAYVKAARGSGLLDKDDREINRLIGYNEDKIYGVGFRKQDEDEALSTSVQVSAKVPNGSGCVPVDAYLKRLVKDAFPAALPQDPAAVAKSKALVRDVAARYGWSATGIDSSGEPTIFHHWKLDIHVYSGLRPQLQATGTDGITRPCLRYEEFMQNTPYKGDAVASLLLTCVAHPGMAEHIEKFCPGYLERWRRYQNQLKAGMR